MFNIRLLIILCFKGGLLNLRVRALYIEIFSILNSFRLELKIETRVFQKGSSLIINYLAEAFYKSVYLRGIWLRKL